jgi:hypothetical protein
LELAAVERKKPNERPMLSKVDAAETADSAISPIA